MTSLEDIDKQLAELRAAETAVTSNLLALEEHPTYQLLSTAGDSMTGITAQRVRPALQEMLELWHHFSLLSDLVARADDLRGTERHVPDARVEELDELLNGHSVPLARREIPLAQRGLLSASHVDEAITPADLLTAMTSAFEQARDVVVAADTAWKDLLPRLEAANNDVASLAKQAAGLGIAEPASLAQAGAALTSIATKIANDPLGAHDDLDAAIGGHLKAASSEIEARLAERDAAQTGVPAAEKQLARINALLARAATALALTREKIKDPVGVTEPPGRGELDEPETGLVARLARIADMNTRREWRLAANDLAQWQKAAAAFETAAEQVTDQNEAPLRRRDELRGLLGASKAKASALGLGENTDVDAVYAEANAALQTKPCDLPNAETLVTRHLATVRALAEPTREENKR